MHALTCTAPTRACLCKVAHGVGPQIFSKWKDGSKWLADGRGFWAALIIYNTEAGISSVDQKVGESWVSLQRLAMLGQMWVMATPDNYRTYRGASDRQFRIRVFDQRGRRTGTYNVWHECSETSGCAATVDAPGRRLW
jgi:hypothetical protein